MLVAIELQPNNCPPTYSLEALLWLQFSGCNRLNSLDVIRWMQFVGGKS